MKRILILLICCGLTSNVFANKFYWIGGSGNWNDINHWGKFSGAAMNSGNNYAGLPTANDTVIFDDGSGFTAANKTVTLNIPGECHDLLWLGTTEVPTFTMNADLSIGGSLFLQSGMTINPAATRNIYFGSLAMSEDLNYTITPNGVDFKNVNIIFRGNSGGVGTWKTTGYFYTAISIDVTGGTWIADGDVYVARAVNFQGGQIDWSEQNISIGYFSSSAGTRSLDMHGANVHVRGYTNTDYWSYTGAGTALNAENSTLTADYNSTYTFTLTANSNDVYGKIILETNNTNIAASLTTDTLVFRRTTTLTEGITIYINDRLIANGCSNTSILLSGSGAGANINMGTAGVSEVEQIPVQNINITGDSAPYTATGCSDLGGNSGWNFTGGKTRYWVGGFGNWSDPAHWSASSGGPGNENECFPSAMDTVIFDQNSGFDGQTNRTVTVNITAYCKEMIWHNMNGQDKPNFQVNAPISIFGSLEWQEGMTVNLGSAYIKMISMQNTDDFTITSNNVIIMGGPGYSYSGTNYAYFSLGFSGEGKWTATDDLQVERCVRLISGNLVMKDINVTFGAFLGNSADCKLDIRNSTVRMTAYMKVYYVSTYTYTYDRTWTYSTAGSELEAEGSHLIMNSIAPSSFWGNSIEVVPSHEYHKISFLNTGGILSSLTVDSLIIGGSNISVTVYNKTVTVKSYLEMTDCLGFNLLEGNSGASGSNVDLNGYINVLNASGVNINHAKINRIKATSAGAPHTVYNSYITSSTGWTLDFIHDTLYWVGGFGNWSDINHWASESGGQGGTGCFPSNGTTVIFDQNSGFNGQTNRTVTVNDVNAYCDNMIWHNITDDPVLALNNNLNIYGSLELQQNMTVTANNSNYGIRMYTSGNDSIKSNGVTIPRIFFLGTGTLSIVDDIVVTNRFEVNEGSGSSLIMKDISAKIGAFQVSNGTMNLLDIRNSTIELTTTETTAWYAAGKITELKTDSSTLLLNGSGGSSNNYNMIYSSSNNSGLKYNKVVYLKTGRIDIPASSEIIIDSLILAGENTTLMLPHTAPTARVRINKYFEAVDCAGTKTVRSYSTTLSYRPTIVMEPGAVINTDHVLFQYVIFNPAQTVNNALIDPTAAGLTLGSGGKTYYWVNGTGNWNDLSHWDIVSGGPGGNGCIPMGTDNVVFDDLSGFLLPDETVTISSVAANCRNMTWHNMTSNFPNLTINGTNLNIYGSLEWQQGMTVNLVGSGGIVFRSTGTDSIINNGVVIQGTSISSTVSAITFNSTGTWTVKDDYHVNGLITLTQGNLIMKDINIYYGMLNAAPSTSSNSLNIENSNIWVHGYTAAPTSGYSTTIYVGSYMSLSASGSVLHLNSPSNYNYLRISGNLVLPKVIFEQSGYLCSTSSSIDTLILKQDGNVSLSLGYVTNINKHFESLNCNGFNTLTSSTQCVTTSTA
ncbi:MAG: hypothetical protein LBG28_04905 [Tannerella sp.]|jgi:hypothetical protein|nr:hypothetical protein [Tannerella sp.]